MSKLINFTDEPIQIRLINGKIADIPPEKCPLNITDKTPIRRIITLDGDNEAIIYGNAVSISGENGFPPVRQGVYYIVTKTIVNALRKIQRGASDLLIPNKTRSGYYELSFANIITELNEDEATSRFVRETWKNSLPAVEMIKYDNIEQKVSDR